MGRGWSWSRLFGGGGSQSAGLEVEVRVVGGRANCFASLPLQVIYTLQSTRGDGILPPFLALHLFPQDDDDGDASASVSPRWTLAWSGRTSDSAALEVPHHLAECISLPDNTKAHLSVVSVLPKAEFVTVEPVSEDDWEILELNYKSAEEAILTQIGIVYEGMKFPLWLNGSNVVKFSVVACSPANSTVRLVPGTEVAVAPKVRKEKLHAFQNTPMKNEEQTGRMSRLRVQEADEQPIHNFEYKGIMLGVASTHSASIHPQTAQKMLFHDLQFVDVLPNLSQKETGQIGKDDSHKKGAVVFSKDRAGRTTDHIITSRKITVRLLFSESVARGHIMLTQSLRRLLRADVHAWIYVKPISVNVKKFCMMTISPVHFKAVEKKVDSGSDLDTPEWDKSAKDNSLQLENSAFIVGGILGLVKEKHSLEPIANSESRDNTKAGDSSKSKQVKKDLINLWLTGQLMAMSKHYGHGIINSIVLPTTSLLHFEVMDRRLQNKTHNLLFVLTLASENFQADNSHDCFELALNSQTAGLECLESSLSTLEEGELMSLDYTVESSYWRKIGPGLSSLTWMESSVADVIKRLSVILSPTSRKFFSDFHCPSPGHILICGPSGSGKTALIQTAAKSVENDKAILAHIVYISCRKLASQRIQKVKQAIDQYLSEALLHSPSIVIFDDLDLVVSTSSPEGSPSSGASALSKYLMDRMDDYVDNCWKACGFGPVAFIASAESFGKVPQALTVSGRFDFHIQLSAPGPRERMGMLKYELWKRELHCPDDVLSEIASKCDGYDGYDLEILVDRTLHGASGRFLSSYDKNLETGKPILVKDDFLKAMNGFVPIAMRGLVTVSLENKITGWENVGGLKETINAIRETIELPSKYPALFSRAPLRLRSNILLFGPPGCGKTHLVAAAAAASSLRFISIKGPELLNKYIGASEEAVRNLFAKAVAAAPCLLFFDEFDSIAPKRGHDNTGVTDRVVNQLLTELDGVETLNGVFVFAATSRPDLLDAALLRPGRLDRLLFCGFPQWDERLDILRVLTAQLPVSSDVDLHEIATLTEGFSGADLQGLFSDAQVAAVNEIIECGEDNGTNGTAIVSHNLLRSITLKSRPSVPEDEKRRLHEIYGHFMESRKSVLAQARDVKGKRATLA